MLWVRGWKPISEYNRTDYDWVLVKFYDGNKPCIPTVAERKADGIWTDRDGIGIPFEVRYFFDMKQLDGTEGLI